jgi:ABC-2 type transport system permease protein
LGLLIALLYLACMQWGGRLLSAASLAEETGPTQVSIGGGNTVRVHRSGLLAIFSSPVAAMIVKDLRYVLRDSVLLSQLGMPVILFFVPFVLAIQHQATRTVASPAEIYPFAASMTGIIVFMQTSIMSLSSIGLESRSFWLVLASPNAGRTVLWAKFVMSTVVSASIGLFLTAASAIVFQASLTVFIVQAGLVVLCSAALCGMGVGISAALPRFVYENPAHRVSAWAMILGFLSTIAYLTFAGVLAAVAWYVAGQMADQAGLIWAVCGGTFVVMSLLAIGVPMAIGARRLEVYQWEH